MSNRQVGKPSTQESSEPVIQMIIPGRSKDLGGFEVRRILPAAKMRTVGPWIFFDHMGPADFDSTSGINVRPHPHINLATVTYLFEGEIFHRDSLGNSQSIFPGDINLMIAGRGIVHSEREREEMKSKKRRLNGLQLWMALPEQHEEMAPEFIHYQSSGIPKVDVKGVSVRVLMGEAYGVTSPVRVFGQTLYVEAQIKKGQKLILPKAEQRGLYVVEGQARIGEQDCQAYDMAVLNPGEVTLEAVEDCKIALVGGEPYGERHIFWNFVSSRKERIERAKKEWSSGEFPTVPGDEEEYIPLPDS